MTQMISSAIPIHKNTLDEEADPEDDDGEDQKQ